MNDEFMIDISNQTELASGTLYLMNIAKSSIDNMSYKFIDECVLLLEEMGSSAFGTVIIMFDGYGDIPAELYELKEVRNWVLGLFEKYPYFLYFINFSLDSHITLLSCIGDIEIVYQGDLTLSPVEYQHLGIDPFALEQKRWFISLPVEIYVKLERGSSSTVIMSRIFWVPLKP